MEDGRDAIAAGVQLAGGEIWVCGAAFAGEQMEFFQEQSAGE
jgi:hypothetical protein